MSSSKVRDSSEQRQRYMFIRTYHSVEQILAILRSKNNVKHWAYCTHDACGSEVHTHVLIVLKDALTRDNVKRWFTGVLDSKGEHVNVNVQGCSKTHAENSFAYLTHDTPECKMQGKHLYDSSCRHVDDVAYWAEFQARGGSEDTLLEATERLLAGAFLRDLLREYGRDFILHYGAIKALVMDIKQEEEYCSYKERFAFADAMENACKLEE